MLRSIAAHCIDDYITSRNSILSLLFRRCLLCVYYKNGYFRWLWIYSKRKFRLVSLSLSGLRWNLFHHIVTQPLFSWSGGSSCNNIFAQWLKHFYGQTFCRKTPWSHQCEADRCSSRETSSCQSPTGFRSRSSVGGFRGRWMARSGNRLRDKKTKVPQERLSRFSRLSQE